MTPTPQTSERKRRMKHHFFKWLLLGLLMLHVNPLIAADWWNMPDSDFIHQYGNLAAGTQQEQSQFAWMLFSRANQPATLNSSTFSQWELWPSDPDTFAPNVRRFTPQEKIRTRPHLQQSKLVVLLRSPHTARGLMNPLPPSSGGEEVTRNQLSYDYIMNNGLNSQAGIVKFLSGAGAKVEFPIGSVETKAFWARGAIAGAYQVGGFSLTGLHLMTKIARRPNDTFQDNAPSWFWTTFEFKDNKGRSAAQQFITYANTLPAAQSDKLLSEAGVPSVFANYVSNGVQIQFFDAKNKKIVLGNTLMEWFLAKPQSQDPTTWKSWSSSCHSCHAQASGQPQGNGINFFNFTAPVGALGGADLPSSAFQSFDFVWALFNAQ
jgi:hypothetical protein